MSAEPQATPNAPSKPREEPQGVDAEATLYEAFCQIPSIGKATCFPNSEGATLNVALQLNQRNLPANGQRKFLTHFTLSEAAFEQGVLDTSLPVEIKDVVFTSSTATGDKTLTVRGGANTTSAILEVWGKGRLLKELHVPKTLHGAVYNDGWFGTGAVWSPDGSKVAYVAELPTALQTPEWGTGKQTTQNGNTTKTTTTNTDGISSTEASGNGDKNQAAPKGWRGIGQFEEDWGELNTGKRPPAIFVLDTTTWKVSQVVGLPSDTSVGQPQWSPSGEHLLFVGWPHAPKNFPDFPQRLGIVYCFNRPCAVYATNWSLQQQQQSSSAGAGGDGSLVKCLTAVNEDEMLSAFSPRFSPDGKTLVYLSQAAAVKTGVHNATSTLCSMPWQEAQRALEEASAPPPTPRTIIDLVWNPSTPSNFPGLYCTMLPEQPFVLPNTIIATTQWRSFTAVVAVDITTGNISRVTPANNCSWSIVGCAPGWVLVSESHPGQPFKLYAAHLTDSDAAATSSSNVEKAWLWSRVPLPAEEEIPEEVGSVLQGMACEVLQLERGAGQPTCEAVVLYSKERPGPRPTVITPHGGPHSCYSASYFTPYTFLVSLGYNVVLLNYRGSTGFGEASIQSLPGIIGVNDVGDCMAGLQAAVDKGFVDSTRVAVVGGSHGGFLTGHLMGQHPDVFRCAVLRNPVCDISLMVHLSDIPDWCFVEACGTEEGKKRAGSKPQPTDYERFAAVSPITHIDKVTSPMLFMLGAKDRRVPLEDGKAYIAAMKRRKDAPHVKCIVFPEDTHALDKPQTEFEQWVNVASWLKEYCA